MSTPLVIQGDCLEVMPTLEAESFDAVITDPPYGLSFMGKDWDRGVPGVVFWGQVLRVTKPGSYLLAFGGTRTFHRLAVAIEDAGFEVQDCLSWLYGSGFPKHKSKLKPAWEPIIMARKKAPKATLLNIDACRIETGDSWTRIASVTPCHAGYGDGMFLNKTAAESSPLGRWPANVLLDEEAAALLDKQSGYSESRRSLLTSTPGAVYGAGQGLPSHTGLYGLNDSGGASRFFYTAKASRSEREHGLEGRDVTQCSGVGALRDSGRGKTAANHHPTVKPVAVMRWLCKLVTPPNGHILDPFTGSGTTGVAATLEGFRFTGIEKEAEYAEIARKRITETPPSLFGEVD